MDGLVESIRSKVGHLSASFSYKEDYANMPKIPQQRTYFFLQHDLPHWGEHCPWFFFPLLLVSLLRGYTFRRFLRCNPEIFVLIAPEGGRRH